MIRIIGAGMAGLLATRMLARHDPILIERETSLPHNHSAVLRFASSKVADVLGIPFQKVQLTKAIVPWRNPVADAMAYAKKVSGKYRTDRSIVLPERWSTSERWIAPEDLIAQMADGLDIRFAIEYQFNPNEEKVISTVPMPVLARKMGHRDLGWRWLDGVNVVARVEGCSAYASVMVPDPDIPFHRASITRDELIIESTQMPTGQEELIIGTACRLLGIDSDDVHHHRTVFQPYAKIAPIDEGDRRNFIYYASTITNTAYQLGRFATWRPGLLLDDVVQDVRIIERWMTSLSSSYDQQRHERRA
jgi:hypothetical protein